MAGKLKLLVRCRNGASTSMMIKLNVEKITKKMGLGIQEICHCAVFEGKSVVGQYDTALCFRNFISMSVDAEKRDAKIVGLKNVVSAKETGKGLTVAINK